MKISILILFMLIALNGFAQKLTDDHKSDEPKYSATDSIVTDVKNNTIHLYGKATFEHDGVNFRADEVIIYTETKKVVGLGSIFIVSVPMIKGSIQSKNKTLLYTMGERMVIVE
ncbi:MAG: hypothetical protein V4721_01240 [Bacteroidota bacterium]